MPTAVRYMVGIGRQALRLDESGGGGRGCSREVEILGTGAQGSSGHNRGPKEILNTDSKPEP